jgi:CxxC motif-containing protein (DUF1111 family)
VSAEGLDAPDAAELNQGCVPGLDVVVEEVLICLQGIAVPYRQECELRPRKQMWELDAACGCGCSHEPVSLFQSEWIARTRRLKGARLVRGGRHSVASRLLRMWSR